MQAKHVYSREEKRLLMDCLVSDESKVLNMLKERQEQLQYDPELRNTRSSQGLRILYNLETLVEATTKSTLLIAAARYNKPQIVCELLKQGANINKSGFTMFTALHWAAQNGLDDIVRLLLENRANIEQKNEYGDTPLHSAAASGRLSTAKILLEFGASMYAINDDGDTPINLAKKENHTHMKSAWMCCYETFLENEHETVNNTPPQNHIISTLVISFSSPLSAPTYPYQPTMDDKQNRSAEYGKLSH